MKKFFNTCHPFAMITILFWSLAYVFTRLALTYFSAFSLGFLRYAAASAALVFVALALRIKPPALRDMPWFILSGAVGFFLYMITFNKGCETVTASTSSIVIASVPVITAVIARVVFKEKLNILQWCAIALSFAGVAVLTVLNGGFTVNTGLLWLIGAAVLLAVYNVLQKRLTRTYPPLASSAYSIFCGTVMLAVFLPRSVTELAAAEPVQIVYVIILGVFSSAAAYCSWSYAFAKAEKASTVSNYMFVTPFLTSLLGYAIGGERVETSSIIGGGIIIIGLLLYTLAGRKKTTDKAETQEK